MRFETAGKAKGKHWTKTVEGKVETKRRLLAAQVVQQPILIGNI